MNRTIRTAAAAAALLTTFAVAACSGGGDTGATSTRAEAMSEAPTPSAKPTPVEHIADTWSFDYQGAKGTFKLASNESDPTVKAVNQVRQSVNGQTITLVPVAVDNTAGTGNINMYGITIVTLDGQQIQSVDLSDSFSSWRDSAGDDTDKYNAVIDAENKYGLFDLEPGARGTALVAFAQPITSAASAHVMPAGGFDEVPATAAG